MVHNYVCLVKDFDLPEDFQNVRLSFPPPQGLFLRGEEDAWLC